MAETKIFRAPTRAWEEESIFARDVGGKLIRDLPATLQDYRGMITVTIDGRSVAIAKAQPSRDALSNVITDVNGLTVPRKNTVYDASLMLYGSGPDQPIPVLCHQQHMKPVGVCRVCSVEACVSTGGRERRALVPACVQPVQDGMVVHTLKSKDQRARERIQRSVKLLVDLLAGEHLTTPAGKAGEAQNELEALAERVQADRRRFAPSNRRTQDQDLSPLFTFDRNACILCNRCIRACNEVKNNHVLGRALKGYDARIAFDLDDKILTSSCVSCGECMLSCPTSAMTYRAPVESEWRKELLQRPGYSAVTAEELRTHDLFKGFPIKYLQWNVGAVVKRSVNKGDVLCFVGEYGATAFILKSGLYGIFLGSRLKRRASGNSERGLLMRMLGRKAGPGSEYAPADENVDVNSLGEPDFVRSKVDLLFGEMSCMNDQPRTATVVAMTSGEIYMVRRNVLAMLDRDENSRMLLQRAYTDRAIGTFLDKVPFFEGLSDKERADCRQFLGGKIKVQSVSPGQVIFRQGETAEAFYFILVGHVKVTQQRSGQVERVLTYSRPGTYFGEFGLIAGRDKKGEHAEEIAPIRNATCTALDSVELITLGRRDFIRMLEKIPSLEARFHESIEEKLAAASAVDAPMKEKLRDFLDQGLYNAQKLLVIDLEACTRCDECTKACANTHGGETRLVRDGVRFGKYLVASACRSCTDPYCLVGCPVDAIHRRGSFAIRIENHCIGCGTCATNCPYGNINMMPGEVEPSIKQVLNTVEPGAATRTQQRATTCDLCTDIVKSDKDEVSCVYACPHDAAFRWSGRELWKMAGGSDSI